MHFSHSSSAFNFLLFVAISFVLSNFASRAMAQSSSYDVQGFSAQDKPTLPLPVELIYEFPPGIWCENLAVRRNGQILVTIATAPEIYQVDPDKKRDPILLYSFPATTVTGIAELEPDVFYVAIENITSSNGQLGPLPGSVAIWKLDLRSFSAKDDQSARVSKVATFPNAGLLNGVAVLNRRKGLLLAADTVRGLIWQLNVHTKEIKVFAEDPLTKGASDVALPLGANGIKVRKGVVYFSNTDRAIIGRLIVKKNKTPIGPAATIVTGAISVDDFTIGANGAFFAAENFNNALSYAPVTGGDAEVIANISGNPTAVAFGRRPEDSQSVYVSCNGGTFADLASSPPPPGKIVRVDVKAFL